MTFSGHAALSVISLAIWRDPAILIPVNIVGHFVGDAIPHAEFTFIENLPARYATVLGDSALVIALGIAAAKGFHLSGYIVGAAFISGFFLDLTNALAIKFAKPIRYLHEWAHSIPLRPDPPIDWNKTYTGRTPTWVKLTIQTLLIVVAFSLTLYHF